MKKISLLLLLTLLLFGCSNKVKDTYDFLLIDEETGIEYYVGTPSGVIYEKATNSDTYKVWYNAENETVNINNLK